MPQTSNRRGSTRSQSQPAEAEPEEPLTATVPGFRAPPATPGPDPIDPAETTITTEAEEGGTGSWAGPELDEPSDAGPGSSPRKSSSRASTPDPTAFAEIIGTFVGLVSMAVRAIRQRAVPVPLPPGVWIADERDQRAIGDPLARIAARHSPVGGEGSADVADGLAALVATADYGLRGLAAEADAAAAVVVDGQAEDVTAEQPQPVDQTAEMLVRRR